MVNHPVTFNVIRNNGFFDAGPRKVTVISDALGRAQVNWTLGSYAGAGENRAEVSALGITAKAQFIATGVAANAALIHPVNFSVFRGEAGNALPEPLQVIVGDDRGNPVQGVPVTFSVVSGNGLVNNQTQIDVLSNSDGKAHVSWVLGPEEGITNNRVEATFPNNPGLPVTFVASGLIPGNPEDTSFSGIVLSNTEEPIPGVTVSILNSPLETQTDDQGQFQLTGIPVGAIHLIADGTTATIPGTWPTLEFEVNTISGRDNTVGMPIYLLPIDIPNAQTVSPTQGANIQVSNVPGFSLDIAPGSVTFRDGSQTGSVSVTQVHRDKVPMPPPNGLNPKLVFTIQPPGAVFDPPAPISYPNVEGGLPGEIVDLYSFDHDLGQWVVIGTGTVSEDGAYIQSDPGVGIIEGGWHFPQFVQRFFAQLMGEVKEPEGPPPPPCPISGAINPVSGSTDQLAHRSNKQGDGRYSESGEYRTDVNGDPKRHPGIDIVGPIGTSIVSPGAGEVVFIGQPKDGPHDKDVYPETPDGGYMIVIKHGGGLYSKLMHLKELPNVSVGNTVSTGDTIGKVGTTGNAEETDQPHVHWEIRQGGFSKTDPSVDPTGCLT
jgi:hypothetical protein